MNDILIMYLSLLYWPLPDWRMTWKIILTTFSIYKLFMNSVSEY